MTPGPFAGLISDELGQVFPRPDGRYDVRFERHIKKPVEKVWAALTIAERLADWFAPVEIDLRLGGAYIIRFEDMDYTVVGKIIELEPLRRLAHTWPDPATPTSEEDFVRYDLEPDGDGCRLNFLQTGLPHMYLGAVPGWHTFFEALPGAIEGVRTPWSMERETAMGERYREVFAALPKPKDA